MKTRRLKKLLNDTNYIIADYGDYIAIGSPYVHDLIKIFKDDFRTFYPMTCRHDKTSHDFKKGTELEFLAQKMQEIVKTEEFKDIVENNDVLENKLPVYVFENGEVVETFTDEYGWPNTDERGKLMHDNEYFKTRQECVEYHLGSKIRYLDMMCDYLQSDIDRLNKLHSSFKREQKDITYLYNENQKQAKQETKSEESINNSNQ